MTDANCSITDYKGKPKKSISTGRNQENVDMTPDFHRSAVIAFTMGIILIFVAWVTIRRFRRGAANQITP